MRRTHVQTHGDEDVMQDLGHDRLTRAAAEIVECSRILDKSGLNLVGEVLRGFGDFIQFEHYPPEDSYDPESHAQYYFHAHPPGEREWSDYGHFHIFLRPKGMPAGISPAPLPDLAPEGDGNDRLRPRHRAGARERQGQDRRAPRLRRPRRGHRHRSRRPAAA